MALPACPAGGGSNSSPPSQIPLHAAGAHHDLRNARDVVGGHASSLSGDVACDHFGLMSDGDEGVGSRSAASSLRSAANHFENPPPLRRAPASPHESTDADARGAAMQPPSSTPRGDAASIAAGLYASCATRATLNSARLRFMPPGSKALEVAQEDVRLDVEHLAVVSETDLVACAKAARESLFGKTPDAKTPNAKTPDAKTPDAPANTPPDATLPGACVCATCGVRDPLDDYGGADGVILLSAANVGSDHWAVVPPCVLAQLRASDATFALRGADGAEHHVGRLAFRHIYADPGSASAPARAYHVLEEATWRDGEGHLCCRLCRACRSGFRTAVRKSAARVQLTAADFEVRYQCQLPPAADGLYAANAPLDTFASGDDPGNLLHLGDTGELLRLSTLEELMLAKNRVSASCPDPS